MIHIEEKPFISDLYKYFNQYGFGINCQNISKVINNYCFSNFVFTLHRAKI